MNFASHLDTPMIVCVCRRVSDKTIERHARLGASFDDIQFELGVATQCGKCEGCARDLWAECLRGHALAHISPLPDRDAHTARQVMPALACA